MPFIPPPTTFEPEEIHKRKGEMEFAISMGQKYWIIDVTHRNFVSVLQHYT